MAMYAGFIGVCDIECDNEIERVFVPACIEPHNEGLLIRYGYKKTETAKIKRFKYHTAKGQFAFGTGRFWYIFEGNLQDAKKLYHDIMTSQYIMN